MKCNCRPFREVFSHPAHVVVLTMMLAMVSLAQAQASVRAFPVAAKRGVLVIAQSPEVTIDGSPRRLSPGARIRSNQNLIVMPASITGQRLVVNYVTDAQGLIQDVWILNAQESLESRP